MGSDKARITYDEKRQYRSVIMQQGRVTLEADWNEAQTITNEETRKEALDFVGPSGTPDDGYRISGTTPSRSNFDLSINSGTMYIGGERVELDTTITYDHQSDWLDRTDPDWINLSDLARRPPAREFVYLYLREQEISAVEDSALREAALGGPDTAARLRLVQHVVRTGVDASDCGGALRAALRKWDEQGLTFNPATMRLASNSTLELDFSDTAPDSNPCEPSAQGGYLGADNQLIRIQISDASDGKFLWGYDNASFLYRVDVIDNRTLQLQSAPVDASHEPAVGQTIEVLLPAARLNDAEFVAAHSGFVTNVQSYARDARRIRLPASLPGEFGDGDPTHSHPPVVFLRVWQEELPFTRGTAKRLPQTGLQITLRTSDSGPFHKGDFWQIAARPGTPNRVYPERYLHGPQPPDGPRLWACPLAAIQWTGTTPEIQDCRNLFDNLVELTKRRFNGCCTVSLRPEDLGEGRSLQTIVDQLKGTGPARICLAPGVYELAEALRISSENRDLTIEACPGEAIIQAATSGRGSFTQGLIIIDGARNVALHGLTLRLTRAPIAKTREEALFGLDATIGVRPLHCTGLTIENCEFVFPTREGEGTLIGAAIFAASECQRLSISRNRFIARRVIGGIQELTLLRRPNLLAAFVQTPALVASPIVTTALRPLAATFLRASLDNSDFKDNYFEGLTAAMLILADTGTVRIDNNKVVECYAGFWLLSLETLVANTTNLKAAALTEKVAEAADLINWDPITRDLLLAATRFPLPSDFDVVNAGGVKASATVDPKTTPTFTINTSIINKVTETLNQFSKGVRSDVKDAGTIDRKPLDTAAADVVGDQALPELAAFPSAVFANRLSLSLDLSHNQVSTVFGDQESGSTAVLIIDTHQETNSSVTMSSNQIRSRSDTANTGILFIDHCAVTGNLFVNEKPRMGSLFLLGLSSKSESDATAITGNVFKGPAVLIARRPQFTPPAPPPMDKWDFFNAWV